MGLRLFITGLRQTALAPSAEDEAEDLLWDDSDPILWGDGALIAWDLSGEWILATGVWNDDGTWEDSEIWNDGE